MPGGAEGLRRTHQGSQISRVLQPGRDHHQGGAAEHRLHGELRRLDQGRDTLRMLRHHSAGEDLVRYDQDFRTAHCEVFQQALVAAAHKDRVQGQAALCRLLYQVKAFDGDVVGSRPGPVP